VTANEFRDTSARLLRDSTGDFGEQHTGTVLAQGPRGMNRGSTVTYLERQFVHSYCPKEKGKRKGGHRSRRSCLCLCLDIPVRNIPNGETKKQWSLVTGGPKFKKKIYKDNYSTCPFHEALSFIFATNIPCFSFQHLSALLDCSSGAALLLRSVSCCACRVRTGVGLRTSNTCCPIQGHRACWEILVASNLMLVQHGLNLLQ